MVGELFFGYQRYRTYFDNLIAYQDAGHAELARSNAMKLDPNATSVSSETENVIMSPGKEPPGEAAMDPAVST